MAYLLGCENARLEYPTKKVFDSVTLGIDESARIGIVGGNGDGKSTLLALLAGSVDPDDGRIMRRRGVRISTLEQTDALDPEATVAHSIVGDVPEYTWASDARVRSVIRGLIADIGWDSRVGELSGGQRRRVDLARVLISDCDVLMLDEPTNHLDVHGIAWLADHLKNRWPKKSGALLVVTHDRWFLDEVCLGMWEVHDGVVEQFEGGYSAYVLQRVERAEAAQIAGQKRRNLLRKELAWLSRGARARATKPKFHVEAARALIADEPPLRNSLELR
ncbi:MAG: ATP-binding cassette domain-containing protein, partial [Coriobacteriia bacterium]